ncbi:hypothetical protein FMM54_01135 [Campylobacter sp. LR185c]|uniref:hypothetical protein n=1 Tax=Campylobacter sp. LR185c TaxID=2014525 RepID=UPI0012380C6E|nr:hypothetical protein [Campylobacter sp. LR185c]KAA6228180.1 hypothetical protein FMM54_01135 [Campylobacter sp. LR185c]KAA8603347.1 hypothetical protein CGP82_07810 [Campylobacter sp. LR185c]
MFNLNETENITQSKQESFKLINLRAFKYIGKKDFIIIDDKGIKTTIKTNEIILLNDDERADYYAFKKALFSEVNINNLGF